MWVRIPQGARQKVNSMINRNCEYKECKKEFSVRVQSDKKKYCSRSCSAKSNNSLYPKRKPEGKCKDCGISISASRTYCVNHIPKAINNAKIVVNSCIICFTSFYTKINERKYCSQKCYNKQYEKNLRKRLENFCSMCGVEISYNSKHCSSCYIVFKFNNKVFSWKNGTWDGSAGRSKELSDTIRSYLLEEANYACTQCGFDKLHPVDSKTILEIDHINGDGYDHAPSNLRVLCPNCHALTSTYKNRNSGKGRNSYYIRIQKS